MYILIFAIHDIEVSFDASSNVFVRLQTLLKKEALFVRSSKAAIQDLHVSIGDVGDRLQQLSWKTQRSLRNLDLVLNMRITADQWEDRERALEDVMFIEAVSVLDEHAAAYVYFVQTIKEMPLAVAQALYNCPSADVDEVVPVVLFGLYGGYPFPNDEKALLFILKTVLERQVKAATEAGGPAAVKAFLRGNSVATRLCLLYAKNHCHGKTYLSTALREPIMAVLSNTNLNLEVEPSKVFNALPPEMKARAHGQSDLDDGIMRLSQLTQQYDSCNSKAPQMHKNLIEYQRKVEYLRAQAAKLKPLASHLDLSDGSEDRIYGEDGCASTGGMNGGDLVRAALEETYNKIVAFVNRFMTSLTETLASMPYGVRWISRELVDMVEASGASRDEAYDSLADLLLLRFLTPTIITPEPDGVVTDTPISSSARRNLTLIAKVMRSLMRASSHREEYMIPLLEHLHRTGARETMVKFFEHLIDVDPPDKVLHFPSHAVGEGGHRRTVALTPREIFLLQNTMTQARWAMGHTSSDDRLAAALNRLPPLPESFPELEARGRGGALVTTGRYAGVVIVLPVDPSYSSGLLAETEVIQLHNKQRNSKIIASDVDIPEPVVDAVLEEAKHKLKVALCAMDFRADYKGMTFLEWIEYERSEAVEIGWRSQASRLAEASRCLRRLPERLIRNNCNVLLRSVEADYRERAIYVTYLVKVKQDLMVTRSLLSRQCARVLHERSIVTAYFRTVRIKSFLSRREPEIAKVVERFRRCGCFVSSSSGKLGTSIAVTASSPPQLNADDVAGQLKQQRAKLVTDCLAQLNEALYNDPLYNGSQAATPTGKGRRNGVGRAALAVGVGLGRGLVRVGDRIRSGRRGQTSISISEMGEESEDFFDTDDDCGADTTVFGPDDDGIYDGHDTSMLLVRRSIEEALEQHVFSRLIHDGAFPDSELDRRRDETFRRHLGVLSESVTVDHDALQISPSFHCDAPWPEAQRLLSRITAYHAPAGKVQCVLAACKNILDLINMSGSVAGADDLFPILVFVVIQINPPCLLSTIEYVMTYHETQMEGESSYYWSQFTIAVEFIKTIGQIERSASMGGPPSSNNLLLENGEEDSMKAIEDQSMVTDINTITLTETLDINVESVNA